jgi:hypothetical protein
MPEMYADNYVKPRVVPVLIVVLLFGLGLWALMINPAIFGPSPSSFLSFCFLLAGFFYSVFELLYRLWPVHTYRRKDGTKITTFYLGWWGGSVERTEFADGRPSVYYTDGGRIYTDLRELVKSSQFGEQLKSLEEFVAKHPEIKPFNGLN